MTRQDDEIALEFPRTSPVIVLGASRSGSTLLRFILDSHPELACPPEVGPGPACMALAILADRLGEGHGNSGGRKDYFTSQGVSQLSLNDNATGPIRDMVGEYYSEYLRRAGKKRWCDKSLDNYRYAPLFSQVFPDAQFICLYRHCMDVISSGLEASPWGPSGFGFDRHAQLFPGNSVAAIGSYWQSATRAILEFENQSPERCIRIRYEDLVTEPEKTAAEIFSFLGVEQVPGITDMCLRRQHDPYGPSDYKIWFTDRIRADSVGRGVRIPARRLPTSMLEEINGTLQALGYKTVTRTWSNVVDGFDPRADDTAATGDAAYPGRAPGPEDGSADEILTAIASRLAPARLAETVERWPALAENTVLIAVEGGGRRAAFRYRFSTGEADRVGPAVDDGGTGGQGDGERHPEISASASTWRALLGGNANMGVELKARRIRRRHCSDSHVRALAYLLRIPLVPVAPHGGEPAADPSDEGGLAS